MKGPILPRVVYCGAEDSLFKKIARNAEGFFLEARSPHFGGSPQKFAQSRRASALVLKIKLEFDLKHQEWLAKNDASVPIIVICQNGTVQTAIHALQYGVYDYFCATQGLDLILQRIHDSILWKSMKIPKRHFESTEALLHGKNSEIVNLNAQARALARENRPVVLFGEAGTGKQHLAFGMYRLYARRQIPFVHYDCRLLQEIAKYDALPVPELVQTRIQKFRKRHSSGVFYLSHLEELNQDQQSEILAQGSGTAVRVLASYEEGRPVLFSEKVATTVPTLKIPALRHHKDDIPILAEHFIRVTAQRRKMRIKAIADEALLVMQEYAWPGNVQELSNVIDRMMIIEPSHILTASSWRMSQGYALPLSTDGANQFSAMIEEAIKSGEAQWKKESLYEEFMNQMEKMLIDLVLPKVDFNQAIAARILGISRNTLREKMRP